MYQTSEFYYFKESEILEHIVDIEKI
jgi:hypothetical protein